MEKTEALVKAISEGHIDLNSLSKEELERVEQVLQSHKSFLSKARDSIAGAMPDGSIEMIKYDSNGQWKFEKAIKPGPTLDYSNMDKPSEDSNTLDYSKMTTPPKPRAGAGAREKRDKALANAGIKPMKS